MAVHLFIQKYSRGKPQTLPYDQVIEVLRRHGTPGRGPVGDLEITFAPDQIAHYGLVIGDAPQGAQCVAFIRPVFDQNLRHLVYELMTRFDAAVFDDALGCAYVTGERDELPSPLGAACTAGVQRISSPQQLWPTGLSLSPPAHERPALRYQNPNPQGFNFVLFDWVEMEQRHLHMALHTRATACNAGTLRALRNVLLKVDTALVGNPGFHVSYHFDDPEANLLLLESPKIAEMRGRATMVVPGEVMLGEPLPEPAFVANADWYFSNKQKATELCQQAQTAHGITIAPGLAGLAALDTLLDVLHRKHLQQRGNRVAGEDADDEDLQRWASLAGACIGETIRREIGGQWGAITLLDHKHPVVRTHTGRNCWPYLIAFNRIMNGAGESVAGYVDELACNARSPTPRNADIAADIPLICHLLLGHGQFNKGGLPLQAKIPVKQLDFSVRSLQSLDAYLATAHAQLESLTRDALSNLALAAGAYLGEVVRRNSSKHWHWTNYEDFFSTRPADPNVSKSVNTCALLIGPGMAILPMQACNIGGLETPPQSVHAQALEWLGNDISKPEAHPESAATPAAGRAHDPASPQTLDINVDIATCVAALKPEERAYVQVQPPPWVAADELRQLFDDYPKLLQQGRVVWAHLIQANNSLFEPGPNDSPAEILYDPHGRLQPAELAPLAHRLYLLKNTKPADPEEARIAEHLTGEMTRAFGMPVPRTISGAGLLESTLLIIRKHLPNRRLAAGYFPILISDACKGSAMILPSRWWPRALAEQWGLEAEQAPRVAPVTPPDVHAEKDQILHVVKPPVPGDDDAAWAYLDQLLERAEARHLAQKKGFLGKLLGRKEAPPARLPDPLFAKYLGRVSQDYPGACELPEDLGGAVLSLLVATGSVNYVVETARREFGLTVFDANHFNIIYRPAAK